MWEQVTLQQILLITDGCSNMGADPVEAARVAQEYGIAVNVIGIVDSGTLGSKGMQEVQKIAAAGGGMHRISEIRQLAQTMQMVTRLTMQMTVQQAVNRELQAIVGKELHDLSPDKRMEVAHMIDKAGEEAWLRLVLLLDVSASMRDKLPQVREAVHDLEIGIQARKGGHQVAVMMYPDRGQSARILADFNENPRLSSISSELAAAGGTPTGPALFQAIQMFGRKGEKDYGDAKSYVV